MIKTHLQSEQERSRFRNERHTCFQCGQSAHYWTQNAEGAPTYQPISRSVWHCQKHRRSARQAAGGFWFRIWKG